MENLWPPKESFIESMKDAIKEHAKNAEFFDENNMIKHRDIELGYIKNLERSIEKMSSR